MLKHRDSGVRELKSRPTMSTGVQKSCQCCNEALRSDLGSVATVLTLAAGVIHGVLIKRVWLCRNECDTAAQTPSAIYRQEMAIYREQPGSHLASMPP